MDIEEILLVLALPGAGSALKRLLISLEMGAETWCGLGPQDQLDLLGRVKTAAGQEGGLPVAIRPGGRARGGPGRAGNMPRQPFGPGDLAKARKLRDQALDISRRWGLAPWYCQEKEFPSLLWAMPDPPLLLWTRGDHRILGEPGISVVGTRQPDGSARTAAWDLGAQCAGLGLVLVSGLAWGIDGSAHSGAVQAGGRSIALLPCGAEQVYPRIHRDLAAQLLQAGGCLVSEYWPGTPPARFRFSRRNRLISGLSMYTVVVQAPEKSGALITAGTALDQGREVLVHRAGTRGLCSRGSAALVEQGARVIDRVDDIWKLQPEPGPA